MYKVWRSCRLKCALKKVLDFQVFAENVPRPTFDSFWLGEIISTMPMVCYAVKAGLQPGIYPTWALCEAQVKGFNGAKFKKFNSLDEAAEFVGFSASYSLQLVPNYCPTTPAGDSGPTNPSHDLGSLKRKLDLSSPPAKKAKTPKKATWDSTSGLDTDFDWKPPPIRFPHDLTPVEVYTDGACGGNGKARAVGGIGVYWGPSHPANVSEPLLGRQTNNRAEIMAAVKAICQAREMGKVNVTLCTDSQFMINGITTWIKKWKRNGWMTGTSEPVINKEDFQKLDLARREMNITWKHVRGHQGVFGNEQADKLAVAGASKK